MEPLRALSVRQPWAHSIVHHGKDVENRTRRFGHRGWTLIHASAGVTDEDWASAHGFMEDNRLPRPSPGEVQFGSIIGVARVVDSITEDDPRAGSPWWMGPYALAFDAAHPLPPVQCKGTVAPLFWTPPADVILRLRPAIEALAIPELTAQLDRMTA